MRLNDVMNNKKVPVPETICLMFVGINSPKKTKVTEPIPAENMNPRNEMVTSGQIVRYWFMHIAAIVESSSTWLQI